MSNRKPISILMADDDPDDRLLAREALEEAHLSNSLYFVQDGQELMDFLLREGDFTDPEKAPRPGIILLDLNMPRMDGREALQAIKSNPLLRRIPVVILTTSKVDEDVLRSYDLGANSFITKPVSFEEFVRVVTELGRYWFEVVALPEEL